MLIYDGHAGTFYAYLLLIIGLPTLHTNSSPLQNHRQSEFFVPKVAQETIRSAQQRWATQGWTSRCYGCGPRVTTGYSWGKYEASIGGVAMGKYLVPVNFPVDKTTCIYLLVLGWSLWMFGTHWVEQLMLRLEQFVYYWERVGPTWRIDLLQTCHEDGNSRMMTGSGSHWLEVHSLWRLG